VASLTGAVLGLLFSVEALRPSLLPRDTLTQILLGALAAATGYALGALAGSVVRWLVPASEVRFSPVVRAGGAAAIGLVALGVALARLPGKATSGKRWRSLDLHRAWSRPSSVSQSAVCCSSS